MSFERRFVLTLLLGLEALAIAIFVVFVSVPWDTTFAAFDGEPISTTEAYRDAAPELATLGVDVLTTAALWFRGGRLARPLVLTIGLLHVVGGTWLLASSPEPFLEDLVGVCGTLIAFGVALVAITGRTTSTRHPVRS